MILGMIAKITDPLLSPLKKWRYWPKVQPYVALGMAYFATQMAAFEYVCSRYQINPSPRLFVGSYIFVQITLVFGAMVVLLAVFKALHLRRKRDAANKTQKVDRPPSSTIPVYILVVAAVLLAVLIGFQCSSPNKVSHIHVVFFLDPDQPQGFNRHALTYLIYELNRQQRGWYYEVDFKEFDERVLTSSEENQCERDESSTLLCYADWCVKNRSKGEPVILITNTSLRPAMFARHRGIASVISTADSATYAPITTYEYLAYSVVVQSIMLHLDAHGRGVPEDLFVPSTTSHGGVFQFAPVKQAMKCSILSAHLSPAEEELLFNRFGPGYMSSCSDLLKLEWLYSDRVSGNLAELFGVDLSHTKRDES